MEPVESETTSAADANYNDSRSDHDVCDLIAFVSEQANSRYPE